MDPEAQTEQSCKFQPVNFEEIIPKAHDRAKGTLKGTAIQIIKEAVEVGDCNVSA